MTSIVPMANSFPSQHRTRVVVEGRRHFRTFCYDPSSILSFTACVLLSHWKLGCMSLKSGFGSRRHHCSAREFSKGEGMYIARAECYGSRHIAGLGY